MLSTAPLSLETIASVFDASEDCVKLIDLNGDLLWMNKGGLCAMELDSFAQVEGRQWADLWPEAFQGMIRAAIDSRPPMSSRLTAMCPTAKGTPKWWEVSIVPVVGLDRAPYGFIATSRDVTDRERMSAMRETLLQEMRHRQGNTLTLAAMLVQVHAHGKPELSRFVTEVGDRLSALGRAQSVVAREDRAGASGELVELGGLMSVLVKPFAGPHCDLVVDSEPGLEIPASKVDVVGVILSELCVNAGKHGAFGSGGQVGVTARRIRGGVEIKWTETARQPVTRHTRAGGQGIDLMGRIASINGGNFEVTWRDHGQCARLSLMD